MTGYKIAEMAYEAKVVIKKEAFTIVTFFDGANDNSATFERTEMCIRDSIKSPYASEQQVYAKFFEELNASIKLMNEQANDRLTASADYIYSGDVKKWIRFANSLKLRLAMRSVSADPTTARKMVEEALDPQYGGVIEQNADLSLIHI